MSDVRACGKAKQCVVGVREPLYVYGWYGNIEISYPHDRANIALALTYS